MRFELRGSSGFQKDLEDMNFKVYEDHFCKEHNLCNWYAVRKTRLENKECECNTDKDVQLVITPYEYFVHGEERCGAEIDLTGEVGGVWYKLQAYGMQQSELITKLPEIEQSLVNAWNALIRE